MFWNLVFTVIGIAIGIVIGDTLNTDKFKNLFVLK
jgi:hypothetical protein